MRLVKTLGLKNSISIADDQVSGSKDNHFSLQRDLELSPCHQEDF